LHYFIPNENFLKSYDAVVDILPTSICSFQVMYLIGFNLIFEIFEVSNFSDETLPMLTDFFSGLKMKNLSLMQMISCFCCYDTGLSPCDSQMVNGLKS
jgi:hypothetical protein